MYDPTVARFLQEDTYTGDKNDPLSLNLYTYCANNPLIYDDPTGHIPQILVAAAVGDGVGLAANGIVDYLDDGKINSGWKSYLGAAAGGATAGTVGIACATVASGLGASAATGFGSIVIIGAIGDFVGSVVEQKISTGKVSIKQALEDTATGAAFFLGGSAIGKLGKKLKIVEGAKNKLADIFKSKSSKKNR